MDSSLEMRTRQSLGLKHRLKSSFSGLNLGAATSHEAVPAPHASVSLSGDGRGPGLVS